jgi:excisionase family DNA binding protein
MSTYDTSSAPHQPLGYRVRELIAITGLSESTIRRWIADGTVATVRVGRSIFIRPDSISRLFDVEQ